MTFVFCTTASSPRVAVSQKPPLVLLAALVALGLTLSVGAAQAQTRTAPLPDNLVLRQRPGSAAPPPGCPQGWKPVSPGVNPC